MVERMLSMHEAQGSIPCFSIFYFFLLHHQKKIYNFKPCSGGVVGYHVSLTHSRSRVQFPARIIIFFIFFIFTYLFFVTIFNLLLK
jgi:hypothetical protein